MPEGQHQTIEQVLAEAKTAIAAYGNTPFDIVNGVPQAVPGNSTGLPPAAGTTTPAPGGDYLHFGLALGVLVVLTLLLPPAYGKWLPFLTLLAFGANNTKLVNNLLNGKISQ